MANNTRKKRQYKTLISVLAAGSTPEARKLLKDYTGQDCVSEADLEVKLATLYADSSSKLDLEKEFAQIHPHKEFIVKYCSPKPSPSMELDKLNTANTDIVKQVEVVTPPSKSNTENPTEGKACVCGYCGGFSNAEGLPPRGYGMAQNQMTVIVLGLVSIVALAGTIMYLKSAKN